MQKVIITSILLLTSLLVHSQDKVIDLSSFSEVKVQEGIQVQLMQGSPKAEVNMLKGDIEDLLVEQKGKVVRLHFKKGTKNWFGNSNNREVEIALFYNSEINSVTVSSGASLKSNETISTSKFNVDASSGAYISLAVEADDIDADASSGATIELEGFTKTLEVGSSSGASFKGHKMRSKIVDVDVSSGASAKVWATEEIAADASSGASVKYKGNPKKENFDVGKWSGGSIRKM